MQDFLIVVACEPELQHMGASSSTRDRTLSPLHWEHVELATGPAGQSPLSTFDLSFSSIYTECIQRIFKGNWTLPVPQVQGLYMQALSVVKTTALWHWDEQNPHLNPLTLIPGLTCCLVIPSVLQKLPLWALVQL